MTEIFKGKSCFLYPPLTISETGTEESGKVISFHKRKIVLDYAT